MQYIRIIFANTTRLFKSGNNNSVGMLVNKDFTSRLVIISSVMGCLIFQFCFISVVLKNFIQRYIYKFTSFIDRAIPSILLLVSGKYRKSLKIISLGNKRESWY